jgi:hypothetical protein
MASASGAGSAIWSISAPQGPGCSTSNQARVPAVALAMHGRCPVWHPAQCVQRLSGNEPPSQIN